MDTDDPLLNAPGRRRGILADALRHTTPPDLMDIPGAVPRPPPKQTSSSRKHPPNPSKQPNPTTSQPSTSRAAAYSPEELAFRQRQGILATALRSYTSVPSLPTATLTRYVVEDTSDDDNRAGMLGMTLKSTKPPLTRRHSHGNVVDQDFEYGTGILGRALSRYSTRESIPKAVENDLGAPKVMKKTVSKKKKPEGTEATISKSPSTMSLVHGAEESLPKTPRNQSPATSEDEAEAEIEELFNLEALTKIDPSAKLLYLAKKNKWGDIEDMLQKRSKLDFSMADKSGYTPLLLAVKHSKLIIIDKLLAHGADLKAMNKERQTALHIAAKFANEETVRKLIDKKMDCARASGADNKLPIHYAAQRKSQRAGAIVQALLRALPSSRLAIDKKGNMPVHLAIKADNHSVVKALLGHDCEQQIHTPNIEGDVPLILAAGKNFPMLRLILEFGGASDVNRQNKAGRTALHEVAEVGDIQMLKLMYKLRADANVMDKDEKTPLHVAAENGQTAIVEALIDKFKSNIRARTRDGSTLLHIAALSGHADTALAFLKRGVPLYMPNKRGALGLHSAAAAGFNDVVKMLIARGTNVDIRTKDNYTALHVAVQSGKASVVETLLGFGADVHVHGGSIGETALHVAAAIPGDDVECAQMLLKSGAQPNVTQTDGATPLHIAARSGNTEMIKLLLYEGANPRLKSDNGETPLHVAAKNSHCEAVELILKHLSQTDSKEEVRDYVNSRTVEGLTAVHYAAQIDHEKIEKTNEDAKLISTLIDYGGQCEIQTLTANETAMHLVARSGNEVVLLALVNRIGAGMVQIVQNKQSKTGWSPLLEACARGHAGVAKILLLHHARIDVFDENGRTALHLAAANGHVELTQVLLQYKAFVNSKAKNGEAPLHLAAQFGHVKVVNVLVQDHGASLEAITLDNQTALHFAAKYGQLGVSQTLLALGANPNARDDKGQTPLHLAAENDYPDVVKLFLKMKQNNRAVLTAIDQNGFTCAHIAAMKGSLAVVRELMMIDKPMVIHAKTKTMEATTLHMAAAGGHKNIVKILLENGANPEDENAHGMTALHLGAKNGHVSILEAFDKNFWKRCSKKTGLNALHIAAYYGNSDFVNEMVKSIPASVRSEPPMYNHLVVKEFATEYGLTPLHLASQSGHDSLVRMLLNQGVQVDATSTTMNVIPLHLAAQQGHIAVVGMLLSRSTQQQHAKDWRGRTPLHLAAMNGHYEMVSLLIAQGSNINVMDQNGWTGMHFATKAGHINVVKLFVDSSADAQAETKEGKVPLCFAAAHNHADCLRFLLKQKHDTHQLMEDRKFIFDLMVCGKTNDNEPLQEFILQSPAPIDTAVKLSSLYRDMSEKEKERAKDLSNVAVYAENMAVELLGITASEYNAALLLKAKDNRGRPLLDVLIENEQKEVVSYASVQRYLTEIWTGRVDWSFGKTLAFAIVVLMCPPAWFYFSLPLDSRIGRAPIIKFVCHVVSHVYFTALLVINVLNLFYKMYEVTSVMPNPFEWLLLLWLSGNLVSELSNIGSGSGLGIVKVLILILSAMAIAVHILAFLLPVIYLTHLDNDEKMHFARTMLYLKNQLFAFALLFAFVEFLDFLTVHHLFGPWAIIIRDLMYDLTRFLVILALFVAGFTLHVTSIFQPAYQPVDEDSAELMRLSSAMQTLEMLFFSLFGLVEPDNMPPLHLVPDFAKIVLKLLFGIYMMVTLIVLINLLIAMMSDTYQRIQAQSDKEWKFGRAILIRAMNKRSATPSPINMLTKLYIVLKVAYRNRLRVCTHKAQQDLRYEENIDAFSMSGHHGRASPTMQDDDDMGGRDEEAGHATNMSLESVIDWKNIVNMYYKMNVKEERRKAVEKELDQQAALLPD
uniref:Ion_trans domain-containing protein n=1 Tax=Panagrellus redivivus TaxID=6233 RepID=A0A7E4VBG3_PANRE